MKHRLLDKLTTGCVFVSFEYAYIMKGVERFRSSRIHLMQVCLYLCYFLLQNTEEMVFPYGNNSWILKYKRCTGMIIVKLGLLRWIIGGTVRR